MRTRPEQLHARFESSVGSEIQRAIVRAIEDGYSSSWRDCQGRCEPETQHQTWRFTRWLTIEDALLAVGKRFKSQGVEARFVPNSEATDVRHVELLIGSVLVTVHRVADRSMKPEHAEYRAALTERNTELLFGPAEKSPEVLWTPILHVPDHSAKEPREIFVAFPAKDEGFVADHIDLLARHWDPEVVVLPSVREQSGVRA